MIMAPTPMTSSPAKGKACMYMCRPCGTRHVPPTGLNCRLQKQKRARASVVDSRRSPKKKTIVPNTTARLVDTESQSLLPRPPLPSRKRTMSRSRTFWLPSLARCRPGLCQPRMDAAPLLLLANPCRLVCIRLNQGPHGWTDPWRANWKVWPTCRSGLM